MNLNLKWLLPGPPWTHVMDVGQVYLLLAAVVRGVNYLVMPVLPPEANALSWLDPDGTPEVWGIGFVMIGVTGLAGELWYRKGCSPRRWVLSWLAYVWLMAGYVMVSLFTMVGAFLRSPFFGFAVPADLLTVAVACAVCASRRGQEPPPLRGS